MIEIQDLQGKNSQDIFNLLMEERGTSFQIFIPKETVLYNSENDAILIDYTNLAYSGQLLFNVSDKFVYEEVPPHEHKSVLFTIETKNLELLASTLLHISYGYVNDHPDDENFNYAEESSNYLDQIKQEVINKIACPYFVDISKRFGKESEENEKEY